MANELKLRGWVYVMKPSDYGVSGCPKCGNSDCQWSEFEKHLWCASCETDFIPESGGLFDGPIGIDVCGLMGITFDAFDLKTKMVIPFDSESWPNYQIT